MGVAWAAGRAMITCTPILRISTGANDRFRPEAVITDDVNGGSRFDALVGEPEPGIDLAPFFLVS